MKIVNKLENRNMKSKTKRGGIPVDLCQDLNAQLETAVYTDAVEVKEAVYRIFNDRINLKTTDRNIKVTVSCGYYKNPEKDVHPTNLFYAEVDDDLEEIITNYYFN
jgi:hypothetical protein